MIEIILGNITGIVMLYMILILLHTTICLFANMWLAKKCRAAKGHLLKHMLLGSIAIVDVYRATIENGLKIVIFQGFSSTRLDMNCTMVQFFICFFRLLNISFYSLLLMALIKEKYYVGSQERNYLVPMGIWMYAMLWSVLPLFGWGELTEIAIFAPHCKVTSLSYYGVSQLICTIFSIPLFSYISMMIRSKSRGYQKKYSTEERIRQRKKRKTLNTRFLAVIVAFIVSLLPYMACIVTYNSTKTIPTSLQIITELSSQTAIIQNPIIYLICNSRNSIVDKYSCRKKSSNKRKQLITVYSLKSSQQGSSGGVFEIETI